MIKNSILTFIIIFNCSTFLLAQKTSTVRILLHTIKNNSKQISLSAKKGFSIQNAGKAQKTKKSNISLALKNKQLYLDGTPLKGTITYINPHDGYFVYNKNTYKGPCKLIYKGNTALLINCLNLEDYVYSVLKTESWPGWPLEINKVLAIVCRTYAVKKSNENSKQSYDIKNTNAHQTYSGVHSCPIKKKAVEQTRGIIICYKKEPILAMYDSCCGGVTPSHCKHFALEKTPYLARKYPCTYCKPCRIYSWQVEYPLTEIAKKIGIKSKKPPHTIKITKKDKAGLVQEVQIKGTGFSTIVSGKKLKSACAKLKSLCFTAQKKSGTVIFNGKGYGHHIGLCQWGAREMVRKGYNYKRILSFYYPETQLNCTS